MNKIHRLLAPTRLAFLFGFTACFSISQPSLAQTASVRILSKTLGKVTKQSIIVDNKGRNIAYRQVARAAPDGYSLLNSYSAYHVGNPNLTTNLPWAQKDFAPVALIAVATNVIAAHPSVPASNLPDFISYVRTNPGKLSYASQGGDSLSQSIGAVSKKRHQIFGENHSISRHFRRVVAAK